MNIELVKIDNVNDCRLKDMFQTYVIEMQMFLDQSDTKNKCLNSAEILNRYWGNLPNWPYLIMKDNEITGFCLLRHLPGEPETIDIDQYYVSKEFRRMGIGGMSLKILIERHPGNWVIRVLKTNTGALNFWIHAVQTRIGTGYECKSERDDMHFIRFATT